MNDAYPSVKVILPNSPAHAIVSAAPDAAAASTGTLKSIGISVVIHVTALGMFYAWPSPNAERFTVAGHRDVIQMTLAEPTPPMPSLTVETAEPLPLETDHPDRPAANDLEARPDLRDGQHARSNRSFASARLPEPPAGATESESQQRVNRRTTPQRQAELQQPPLQRPRRVTPHRPPQVSAMPLEYVVGLDQDRRPDLSNNPPPQYPGEAIRRGWEGTVLLRLAIDASGRIARVTLERSSGHGLLDRAAIETVEKWTGSPARRGGAAVASEELLPVRFQL